MTDEEKVCFEFNAMLLDEYRNAVNTLFQMKSKRLIPNQSVEHAAIINEMIIKYAPQGGTIYYMCKNLDRLCFDNERVLCAAKEAMERQVFFKVAHSENIDSKSFIEVIHPHCKIYHIKSKLVNGKEVNFTTNGESIRFEPDASIPHADVIPNAREVANFLIKYFEGQIESAPQANN